MMRWDFSGSELKVFDIKMNDVGDKGISAGEKSTVVAENIQILGAITALASKDGSWLKVTNTDIHQAEVGVAVFRKKPEYAPAQLILNGSLNHSQIDQLSLIQKHSILRLNGLWIWGQDNLDIDEMYARFAKKQ